MTDDSIFTFFASLDAAAEILGIGRATLLRKRRLYGLT